MSSVEPARHALYSRLEEVLGDDHAKTLMTHLPLHPYSEAATKGDIAELRHEMESRFDRMDERFNRMEKRFEGIEERLGATEQRWDDRFSTMEQRWDDRFSTMEQRSNDRFLQMQHHWDDRFDELMARLDRNHRFYAGTTIGALTALTGIFSLVVVVVT